MYHRTNMKLFPIYTVMEQTAENFLNEENFIKRKTFQLQQKKSEPITFQEVRTLHYLLLSG